MNDLKRTIITTCGISLYESCCWNYPSIINDHYTDCINSNEFADLENNCRKVLKSKDNAEEVSKEFQDKYWDNLAYIRDFPAELASLHAMEIYLRDEVKKPLCKDDKIILLHSCGEEGQFCVDVLHAVLKKPDLLPGVKKHNINKYPIADLDPSKFETFAKGLKGIWDCCINKFVNNDTEYFFNLTGGYKATATLLGAVAYRNEFVTNIFYLHEDAKSNEISTEICIFGFNAKKDRSYRTLWTEYYNIVTKESEIHGSPDRYLGDFS